MTAHRILRRCCTFMFVLAFLRACPFDDTLREYLDAHFWLPFSKFPSALIKRNVRRISVPYAGMLKAQGDAPIEKLRTAYQEISQPDAAPFKPTSLPQSLTTARQALAATRADRSLTGKEREETDLIDAKIDMRSGEPDEPEPLRSAKKKLEQFLTTARTPEFLSEARGWLAHVDYLLGDQTAAGKIYLDELNRSGSNLSRETLLNSLSMNYGYDGGPELLEHLEKYFDTPEHASFAIQLVTNPHSDRGRLQYDKQLPRVDNTREAYPRIQSLLEKHSDLLKSEPGANALALLGMRTALRMGDPPAALKVAEMVPSKSAIRAEPDFDWMLASAHFLSHDYTAAERPLLDLFHSSLSSESQKSAAAYGLCGVYQKLHNPVEQIHFALWLLSAARKYQIFAETPNVADQSIYWATSGWDLNLLLDLEAPIDVLEVFLRKYPDLPDTRVVKYSLAVRMARENRYEEAAQIFEGINALRRAPRMRQLATLYQQANRTDLSPVQLQEAKYAMGEFIGTNPNRIYYNDLWNRYQGYALTASTDSRLTRQERQTLMDGERILRDEQEERWRAYLILRDVVRESENTVLGRDAARVALHCLRGINERFGRQDEIRDAESELSKSLRKK